jgi:ABC-2 type transport system ATP-binding protein
MKSHGERSQCEARNWQSPSKVVVATEMSLTDHPAILFRQLTRRYGRRVGVDALNLSVKEGEIFGFLGPNGAGKTTAIRLMLGFLRPSSGSAQVFGQDCWAHSPNIKREVGYLPGDLRIYPWMTARSALRTSGRVRRKDLTSAAQELTARFRIDLDLPARKMSRGMRQKVGLLLALAHRPKLLVLDEPTTGLDPLMQNRLCDCLREMADEGHTIFFSSHWLREVEQLCDRVAIVRRGKIVADERLDGLRQRAGRSVMLLFSSDQAADQATPPEGLTIGTRIGRRWEAEFIGPMNQLLSWIAQLPLDDLQISPPNLDRLFHAYYQSSEA